jgi:hypothetical protein
MDEYDEIEEKKKKMTGSGGKRKDNIRYRRGGGRKRKKSSPYAQVPFPSHLPLVVDPAMAHFTLGRLGLEGPQARLARVPRQRGTLKQELAGLPHLLLTPLNWQLVLQQEAPAKFPNPGSHCSPTSTRAFPHTGGTVTEGVAELVEVPVPEGVPVPVPDPVTVTEGVHELEREFVHEGETDLLLELVHEEVHELELEVVHEFEFEFEGEKEGSAVSVWVAEGESVVV